MRWILVPAAAFLLALPADARASSAAVELRVYPGAVEPAEIPHFLLVNTGDVGVAYGTPYKLERWTNGSWRWINRRQGWRAPLLGLAPGKTSRPEPIVISRPNPEFERCPQSQPCCIRVLLRPGLYRVTKSFDSAVGTLTAGARFRVVDRPTGIVE
jgi:hypothetical protein